MLIHSIHDVQRQMPAFPKEVHLQQGVNCRRMRADVNPPKSTVQRLLNSGVCQGSELCFLDVKVKVICEVQQSLKGQREQTK